MKKKCIESFIFAGIFFLLFTAVTLVKVPKSIYPDEEWGTTSVITGFYKMKKNSVDVLILGSSAAQASIIPQELYNRHQIRSYNLSFPAQNMIASYYWLKEALRSQKPSVLIIEVRQVFSKDDEKFTNESFHAVFDFMKYTPIKEQAIRDICTAINKVGLESCSQSAYRFLVTAFHTRDITEKDSVEHLIKTIRKYQWMGFYPLETSMGTYTPRADDTPMQVSEIELNYLQKILSLCEEHQIQPILYYAPKAFCNDSEDLFFQEFAAQNNLPFVNFNQHEISNSIGYDVKVNNWDANHVNLSGAKKISDYLGDFLVEKACTLPVEDAQYDDSAKFYANFLNDLRLRETKEIDPYLESLQAEKDRYWIFVAAQGKSALNLGESSLALLRQLGLKAEQNEQEQNSYLAVIMGNKIIEKSGSGSLQISETIRNDFRYFVQSEGWDSGMSSIQFNDTEYTQQLKGLNVVIFDSKEKNIVDSVNFDTAGSEYPAVLRRNELG